MMKNSYKEYVRNTLQHHIDQQLIYEAVDFMIVLRGRFRINAMLEDNSWKSVCIFASRGALRGWSGCPLEQYTRKTTTERLASQNSGPTRVEPNLLVSPLAFGELPCIRYAREEHSACRTQR
jgi:hypothetical protein